MASHLLQVSTIHADRVTMQLLFSRFCDGQSEMPPRTRVLTFTAEEVRTRLHPATAQLINSYTAILDAHRMLG